MHVVGGAKVHAAHAASLSGVQDVFSFLTNAVFQVLLSHYALQSDYTTMVVIAAVVFIASNVLSIALLEADERMALYPPPMTTAKVDGPAPPLEETSLQQSSGPGSLLRSFLTRREGSSSGGPPPSVACSMQTDASHSSESPTKAKTRRDAAPLTPPTSLPLPPPPPSLLPLPLPPPPLSPLLLPARSAASAARRTAPFVKLTLVSAQ